MAKPLSKVEVIRNEQIAKRLKTPTFGLGFWSAVDATGDNKVKAAALTQARKAFPFKHGNWAESRHHFTHGHNKHTQGQLREHFKHAA